jgi:hypothetical protein
MKLLRLVPCIALLGLSGCGSFYDDNGAPDPESWWPWVCPDGAMAPDAGCAPVPICSGGEAEDAGADGACGAQGDR